MQALLLQKRGKLAFITKHNPLCTMVTTAQIIAWLGAIVAVLFGVIVYFLKEIHRDIKQNRTETEKLKITVAQHDLRIGMVEKLVTQ